MTSIAPVAPAPTPSGGPSKTPASGGSDFARVLDSAARDHQGGAHASTTGDAAVTPQDSAGPGSASSGEATQVAAALTDVELAALAALMGDADALAEAVVADGEAGAVDLTKLVSDDVEAPVGVLTPAPDASASPSNTDEAADAAGFTNKPAAAITPSTAAAASGLAGSPSPDSASPTPPVVVTTPATTAPTAVAAPADAATSAQGVAPAIGAAVDARAVAEGASAPAPAPQAESAARVSGGETTTAVAAPAAPTPAPASAPSAPVHHMSPAQPPAPLATQLSGQLMSLRQLPQGDHVMTLTVNPDTFGPVRVVAHISADGVHLELFGASEQARAALRAALPDLRRDLAGAGLDSRLDLGAESNSDGRQQSTLGDASEFGQRPGRTASQVGPTDSAAGASAASPSTSRSAHAGAIDVDL